MTDTTSRTIIIEDVPATHEESLKDFLENRGKGGGRVELFERDHLNAKDMIVMFAHHNGSFSLCLGQVIVILFEQVYSVLYRGALVAHW